MKARLRRALNSLEEEELKRTCEKEETGMMHDEDEDEEENIRKSHKAAGVKNVARLLMKTGRGKRKNESNKRVTPFVVRCESKDIICESKDITCEL